MKRLLIILIGLILILGTANAAITDNLISYFNMEEASGNTLDQVNSNDGTVNQMQYQAAGKLNYGYQFDGTDDYTTLANESTFDFLTEADGNWTLLWWQNNVTNTGQPFSKYTSNAGINISTIGNDAIRVDFYSDGGRKDSWSSTVNVSSGWHMMAVVVNDGNVGIYSDLTREDPADGQAGTFTTVNNASGPRFGASDTGAADWAGYMDEVGIWDRPLTDAELTTIYNGGDGLGYPFTGVTAGITTSINKTTGRIDIQSTSTAVGTTINDWNWLVDSSTTGINNANDENTYYTATELTDYNIFLRVGDGAGTEDETITGINSGDWTAPDSNVSINTTEFADRTVLTFQCWDSNSGCDILTYALDGGADQTADISSGTVDINVIGGGSHTLTWDTNDNGYIVSSNREAQQSDSWTKYGQLQVNVYGETSAALINGVSVTLDGNTQTTVLGQANFDLRNISTINSFERITIAKTGYKTRYYELDINRYTAKTINFLLAVDLNEQDGRQFEFKFYDENGWTTLSNRYVNVRLGDQLNRSVGRIKTDGLGQATFYMRYSETAYNFYIEKEGETTLDYNALNLTINRPKDEQTEQFINANWNLTITGLAKITDYDINYEADTSKTYAVYSNTWDTYQIKVDSNSTTPEYYPTIYEYSYRGITTADTLQPWLLNKAKEGANQITFKVVNTLGNIPLSDARVEVFKVTQTDGIQEVASFITGQSGLGNAYLTVGEKYKFRVWYRGSIRYIEGSTLKDLTITGTSMTLNVDMTNQDLIEYTVLAFNYTPWTITTTTTGWIKIINLMGETVIIERYFEGVLVAAETTTDTTATGYDYTWTLDTDGVYNIKIYKDVDGLEKKFIDWNYTYGAVNYVTGVGTEPQGNTLGFTINATTEIERKVLFLMSFLAIIVLAIGARVALDKGLETFFIGSILMGIMTLGLVPWLIIGFTSGMWLMTRLSKQVSD